MPPSAAEVILVRPNRGGRISSGGRDRLPRRPPGRGRSARFEAIRTPPATRLMCAASPRRINVRRLVRTFVAIDPVLRPLLAGALRADGGSIPIPSLRARPLVAAHAVLTSTPRARCSPRKRDRGVRRRRRTRSSSRAVPACRASSARPPREPISPPPITVTRPAGKRGDYAVDSRAAAIACARRPGWSCPRPPDHRAIASRRHRERNLRASDRPSRHALEPIFTSAPSRRGRRQQRSNETLSTARCP